MPLWILTRWQGREDATVTVYEPESVLCCRGDTIVNPHRNGQRGNTTTCSFVVTATPTVIILLNVCPDDIVVDARMPPVPLWIILDRWQATEDARRWFNPSPALCSLVMDSQLHCNGHAEIPPPAFRTPTVIILRIVCPDIVVMQRCPAPLWIIRPGGATRMQR